jgi:hypothetical protein
VLFPLPPTWRIIALKAPKPPAEEYDAMLSDLILALVFLAMIFAPAILAMPDKDERDPL